MTTNVTRTSTIVAKLDPSGYVGPGNAIAATNAKIAASGAQVVSSQEKQNNTTRGVVTSFERLERQMDTMGAANQRYIRDMDRVAAALAKDITLTDRAAVVVGRLNDAYAKSAMATASQTTATEQLRARLIPAEAALLAMRKEVELVNAAQKKGIITSAEAKAAIDRLTAATTVHGQTQIHVANAYGVTGNQLRMLAPQVNDLFTSISTGSGVMQALLQQGGQITPIFGGVRGTLAAMGGALLSLNPLWAALAAAVGIAAVAMTKFESQARTMNDLQNSVRGYRADWEAASKAMYDAAKAQALLGRNSASDLRAATKPLSQAGISDADLRASLDVAENLAVMWGITLPEAAKKLADSFVRPTEAAKEMATKGIQGANAEFVKQVELLELAGRKLEAYNRVLEVQRAASAGAADNITAFQQSLRDLGVAWDKLWHQMQPVASFLGGAFISVLSNVIERITWLIDKVGRLAAVAKNLMSLGRNSGNETAEQLDAQIAATQAQIAREANQPRSSNGLELRDDSAQQRLAELQRQRSLIPAEMPPVIVEAPRAPASPLDSNGIMTRSITASPTYAARQKQAEMQGIQDRLAAGGLNSEQVTDLTSRLAALRKETAELGKTSKVTKDQVSEFFTALDKSKAGMDVAEGAARNVAIALAGLDEAATKAGRNATMEERARVEAKVLGDLAREHADVIANIERSIASQQAIADAYGVSNEAGRQAEAQQKAINDARGKYIEGSPAHVAAIEAGTQANLRDAASKADESIRKSTEARREQIDVMRLENSLAGVNIDTREQMMAAEKAYRDAKRQGATEEVRDEAARVAAQLERQQQVNEQANNSWDMLRNAGSQAFEKVGTAITTAFANGTLKALKFKDILKGLASDLAQTAIKMAILNPIQNYLFGGGGGTVMGLFGGATGAAAAPWFSGTAAGNPSVGAGPGGGGTNGWSATDLAKMGYSAMPGGTGGSGMSSALQSIFGPSGLEGGGYNMGSLGNVYTGNNGGQIATGFTGMDNVANAQSGLGGTVGQAVGGGLAIAGGAYTAYQGIQRGGIGGYTQAAGGVTTAALGAAVAAGLAVPVYGWIAAAVLTAVGAMLPSAKPSNREGNFTKDLSTGATQFGGQTGDKISYDNRHAAHQISDSIVSILDGFQQRLGLPKLAGSLAVAVGDRDGIRSQYTNPYTGQETIRKYGRDDESTKTLVREAVHTVIAGNLSSMSDSIRTAFNNVDWSDLEKAFADLEFANGWEETLTRLAGVSGNTRDEVNAATAGIAEMATEMRTFRDRSNRLGLDSTRTNDAIAEYLRQTLGLKEATADTSALSKAVNLLEIRFAALSPVLAEFGISAEETGAAMARAKKQLLDDVANKFDTTLRQVQGREYIDQAFAIRREWDMGKDDAALAGRDPAQLYSARLKALVDGLDIGQIADLATALQGWDDTASNYAKARLAEAEALMAAQAAAEQALIASQGALGGAVAVPGQTSVGSIDFSDTGVVRAIQEAQQRDAEQRAQLAAEAEARAAEERARAQRIDEIQRNDVYAIREAQGLGFINQAADIRLEWRANAANPEYAAAGRDPTDLYSARGLQLLQSLDAKQLGQLSESMRGFDTVMADWAAAVQQERIAEDNARAAQEAAAKAAEEAAEAQRVAAEEARAAAENMERMIASIVPNVSSLTGYARSLRTGENSPLSPRTMYDSANSTFQRTVAGVGMGDIQSLRDLQSVSDDFLAQSRNVNGSAGGQYLADFTAVINALETAGKASPEALTASVMREETRSQTATLTDELKKLRNEVSALRRETQQGSLKPARI